MFCQGLEKAGLSQSRRALRVLPKKLEWTHRPEKKQFALRFELPAGAYATVMLRELVLVGCK